MAATPYSHRNIQAFLLYPLLCYSYIHGSWNDVAVPYLHEMFDRNVLWTLKKFPQLIYPTPIVDEVARKVRLAKVFEATTVSNHLAMFHVYFLKVGKLSCITNEWVFF